MLEREKKETNIREELDSNPGPLVSQAPAQTACAPRA